VLAGYTREDDETCAVGLEALDVGGEGGGGEVCAAMVDRYPDCGRQLAGYAGFLSFPNQRLGKACMAA